MIILYLIEWKQYMKLIRMMKKDVSLRQQLICKGEQYSNVKHQRIC